MQSYLDKEEEISILGLVSAFLGSSNNSNNSNSSNSDDNDKNEKKKKHEKEEDNIDDIDYNNIDDDCVNSNS
eukprot:CAMPEP_0184860886 /NCGR_PEP_ID=MMETSP0580-20130426/5686_1 /TAXON_ID=1118495 /ORGANISM="Dactyliosolen fragilissimus" /LENGTH=71 /DNA_ID=CAMNT_0027358149 /DNA_START=46 /DNA_END=257 /DNA_ORIENTATION=+